MVGHTVIISVLRNIKLQPSVTCLMPFMVVHSKLHQKQYLFSFCVLCKDLLKKIIRGNGK